MPNGAVPFPFGHCRICNDKATGFHYGVATCEGCKGFFKRSIPKGDKYTCFFGGQCKISPFNRNRCKACRFKRCLDNGMAIEAVKMGRIPQVEKERALLEANHQAKPHDMDIDTEGTESKATLRHNEWIESDFSKTPQVIEKRDSSSICKESLEWSILSSRCIEKETGPSSAYMFSAPEWRNKKSKGLTPVSNSKQSDFKFINTGLDQSNTCFQGDPHLSSSGSVKTHTDVFLEKSRDMKEAADTLSTLAVSSSAFYENQTVSQTTGECYDRSSRTDQLSAGLANNSQGNTSFPNHSRPFAHSAFFGTSAIKTEPEVHNYSCISKNRTIHCENPFAESSLTIRNQKMRNNGNPASFADMTLLEIFDTKPTTFSTETGVGGEMFAEANIAHGVNSYESLKYNRSILVEADVDNVGREDNECHIKTNIYRKSCYSPGVIKVLMDQVGENRINGMKQQIMTTIAKTCGPDEYEATAQLLTSFTNSSEQQKDEKSDFLQHKKDMLNLPSISDFTQSFVFDSNPHVGPQSHNSMTLSLSTHYQQHTSTVLNPLHAVLPENSQNLTTLPPYHSDLKTEPPSKLLHEEHDAVRSLKHAKSVKLPHQLNCAQLSVMPSMSKEFHDCHNNAMDTSESYCKSNECSPIVGQFLTEENGPGTSRFQGKKSSSDKDIISSTDSSNLDDLTMAEIAHTLSVAYEKHMADISRKYERMMDHVQNKKAIPSHPVTPEGKAKVFSNLIASIPDINKRIIGFSQDVPGFALLPKEDKEILMKRGYYDIWMLTNSKLFYGDESYLQFDDGTFYTRALMEIILNTTMVQKLIDFAKNFNGLVLSDLEIAILCAIQLTSANHEPVNLKCREMIQQMNSQFVDLLVLMVSKQHPSNCSRTLVDIFRLMPDLSEINMMQREIIANFSISEPPENVEYKPKTVPLADISETDLAALADS